jgi:hypothetical protein
MRRNKIVVLVMLVAIAFAFTSQAQDKKNGYEFTEVKNLDATDIKNQYRSGTCWSYSTHYHSSNLNSSEWVKGTSTSPKCM